MNLIAEGFRLFGSLSYANFFPIMRYLPGLQEVIKKIAKVGYPYEFLETEPKQNAAVIIVKIILLTKILLIDLVFSLLEPNGNGCFLPRDS